MLPALSFAIALYGSLFATEQDAIRLFAAGPSRGRGVLVNRTPGARPADPINRNLPTLVVVHGLNPLHPFMHMTVGERYAEAVARAGMLVNVLEWDWNASTLRMGGITATRLHAIHQGYRLGEALLSRGIEPASVHLIGQSAGCLAAAAAAWRCDERSGRPVGRLTLIDPFGPDQGWIFGRLDACRCAVRVEHLWAPGPSGFGGPAHYPGVVNVKVPGPSGLRGLLRPLHSDHLNTLRWHIRATAWAWSTPPIDPRLDARRAAGPVRRLALLLRGSGRAG